MGTKPIADLAPGDVIVIRRVRTVKAAWTNAAGTKRSVVYDDDGTEEFDLAGDPAVEVDDG